MKKNLLLSFVIAIFSFISFLFFIAETYFWYEKINNFLFLLIAFSYVFVFSVIINFIVQKIFKEKNIYREVAISFLIIMIGLFLINLIEILLLKIFVDFDTNNILIFISNILQSLRLTFEFSIPIYIIVNILEFTRNRLFNR